MRIHEELILFFTVLKWLVLSILIGCLVGLAASGFILFIHYIIERSDHYENAFYLLPLSFFTANVLSQFVLKRHLGTDALIAAINKNNGADRRRVHPNQNRKRRPDLGNWRLGG